MQADLRQKLRAHQKQREMFRPLTAIQAVSYGWVARSSGKRANWTTTERRSHREHLFAGAIDELTPTITSDH